jgi:ribonuclease Z
MRIECLGTTGYHPCDQRHTSCYVLADDGIVLDAGTGMYRLMPHIKTPSLDILISHAHLDHIVGLTFLLDILYRRPVDVLRVWGEEAKLNAIREHLFHDAIFPVPINAQWCTIDQRSSFEIGSGSLCDRSRAPVTVDWKPQEHPGGSVAYRLRWPNVVPPKTLVYATDTSGDDSDEMRSWMNQCDLLMHECYFCDHQQDWAIKTGHCWTSRAAGIAKTAMAKKLLLTHVSPLATGGGNTESSGDLPGMLCCHG